RPFVFGDQVADPKPPRAAKVKSRAGERRGKLGTMIPAGMVERGERKQTVAEASKNRLGDVKAGSDPSSGTATTTRLAQQWSHPPTRLPPAVRPVPVELSRSQHHGPGLQLAALNSIDRYHLRVIAGREDFICIHEVGNLQRRFLNLDACSAQQLNGAP